MGDSIPLVELSGPLESGTHNPQSLNTSNARSHDLIQALLRDSRKASPNLKYSSHIRRIQHDYARIKDRCAEHRPKKSSKLSLFSKSPSDTEERPSCDNLFSYWLLVAPGPAISGTSRDIHNEATHVQPEESFAEWTGRIASNLKVQHQDALQLIAMTESPDEEQTSFMFSSWHYFVATVSGRLGTIYSIPVRVLQATVAHYWRIETMMIPGADTSDPLDPSFFSRPRPLRPPSMRTTKSSHEHPASSPTIVWGQNNNRPGNIDPSRGDHEILLTWMRHATKFDSDLAVYIWEHHNSIPDVDYAKIVLTPRSTTHQHPRLLISFRSSRSNKRFRDMRNITTKKAATDRVDRTTGTPINWSPSYEAFVSISIVIELVIEDTAEFLDACHAEVSRISFLGRQNPSTSKMRFLIHLEDCCKAAQHGAQHGIEILESLGNWTEEKQIASACQQRLEVLEQDLRYLDRELEKLRHSIQNDKDMLRQHFQLSSDMTAFRLTLLAGIFLPLSFTTSIFGMNIEYLPTESLGALSNFTKDFLTDVPKDMHNSTQAIVSSVSESGPMTYSWITFAAISLCVLVALPLTLTIGFIVRNLVVLSAKYIIYWRVALIVVGVPFALTSMFGAFIGVQLYSNDLEPYIYNGTFYGYVHRSDGKLQAAGNVLTYSYWAFNGILGLFLIGMTYRAWSTMKRGRFFWTTSTFAVAGCCMAETFTNVLFPLMVIPWLFIALWYMIPWIRNRWREANIARLERNTLEAN